MADDPILKPFYESMDDLSELVQKMDDSRLAIIRRLRVTEYIVPSDEERSAEGLDPVTLTEIPDWIKDYSNILVCKTETDFNVCKNHHSDGETIIYPSEEGGAEYKGNNVWKYSGTEWTNQGYNHSLFFSRVGRIYNKWTLGCWYWNGHSLLDCTKYS